jgi:hypothetical protein
MVAERLVELIEIQADRLAADVAQDLMTNARTAGFRRVNRTELEERLFQLLHHLGNWISDRRSEKVQVEFADWGSRRFDQGIPISQIAFAIIVLKQHLRRYIHDHGLMEASFPRMDGDYVLPMHLHSLQELNTQIGLFFDEALYHLALGYERVTAGHRPA